MYPSVILFESGFLVASFALVFHGVFLVAITLCPTWVPACLKAHVPGRFGFIVMPISAIGLFLFLDAAVVLSTWMTGSEVEKACSANADIHCIFPGQEYGIRFPGSGLDNVENLLQLDPEITPCLSRGIRLPFFGVSTDAFVCEDVGELPNISKLIDVVSLTGATGECNYLCTSMRPPSVLLYINDAGMIVGGGVFIMGLTQTFVNFFKTPAVVPSTSADDLADIFAFSLHRPGVMFWNACRIRHLWHENKRHAFVAMSDPLILALMFAFVTYLATCDRPPKEILVMLYLWYCCLITWFIRVSTVVTTDLWHYGYDSDFLETNSETGLVSKRSITMADWMGLSSHKRYVLLVGYIANVGPPEVNVAEGEPKLRVKVIETTRDDDDNVIAKGETGTALRMNGDEIKVRWDEGNRDPAYVNQQYLVQDGGDETLRQKFPWIYESVGTEDTEWRELCQHEDTEEEESSGTEEDDGVTDSSVLLNPDASRRALYRKF